MSNKMLRGTMLLTGANYTSKILGLLYVIPFYALVGNTGGVLYSYAYNPYQIFLTLSSLGIPMAMSKFVAKYDALEDYETKQSMFKTGMMFMMVMGLVMFLIMFFSADWLAQIFISDTDLDNSVEDAAFVIKMVSFALIVVAPMSLIRGYFQGHQSMAPTAFSIVVEQIVRIGFLLLGAFIVMKVLDGTIRLAVGLAAFAALIGAIAAAFILYYFYRRHKPQMERELEESGGVLSFPKSEHYRELLSYAGPFVLVGIATPLYQMVDQFTFNRIMSSIGQAKISEDLLSVILVYGHKLVIIPVTLSIGLAMAVLPAITKAFTENDNNLYKHYINQAILIVVLLVLPAAVGLSILSVQAYGVLYEVQDAVKFGGAILSYYAPVSLFFALFTVSAAILQGINRQNFAVISLAVGLVLKIVLNFPLVSLFQGKGAVMATGIAVLTAAALNLYKIHRVTGFNVKPLYKQSLLIAILTVAMAVVVIAARFIAGLPFSDDPSRLKFVIQTLIAVPTGGYVYLWLAYKTTLLQRLLGDRVNRLAKLFP
ncbi:putative polysaccharide biosynthesis protein [Piscibacillus salipiscarius]|uniref:Oligosaccharide flippase family protein n=1 Tax=Piscibacillus salipiscarius TaxID=299480 RepID=A0ABW5QE15_9BACI